MPALQTRIRLPEPLETRLSYGDNVISLGSCFSEHIGEYLANLGHHISVNPFGALYNPLSIAEAMNMMAYGTAVSTMEVIPQRLVKSVLDASMKTLERRV